jgi:hypothetical protein
MLKEALENFIQPVYAKAKRGSETYAATAAYVYEKLDVAVKEYHISKDDVQTRRLIRDTIDHHLRRYHGYCIKENIGSHYRERNIQGKAVFEHMIPNAVIRDLLLAGILTPQQACNPPTCTLSVDNDKLLRQAGWTSKTPDVYNFWERYKYCFETQGVFETYTGTIVNTDMTLDEHYERFL